jgi:hypothetical protein
MIPDREVTRMREYTDCCKGRAGRGIDDRPTVFRKNRVSCAIPVISADIYKEGGYLLK